MNDEQQVFYKFLYVISVPISFTCGGLFIWLSLVKDEGDILLNIKVGCTGVLLTCWGGWALRKLLKRKT